MSGIVHELPVLPFRPAEAHKGDFGTALLVGGSRGMAGAIALAGMAALRGGAGLVRLAVPDVCLDVVAGFEPSYMTEPLTSDGLGHIAAQAIEPILASAEKATVVACGPGLGRTAELDELVPRLYTDVKRPMVFDADALNALAAAGDVLVSPRSPRVLTPHPGEFARLVGRKLDREGQCEAATELAAKCEVVIVLKGHQTFITDGRQSATNITGNPGMATGGAGDVLTGLIAALWCQGLDAFGAARLGVYLHGLAGDLAVGELGEPSLIASDLVRYLPHAFARYRMLSD